MTGCGACGSGRDGTCSASSTGLLGGGNGSVGGGSTTGGGISLGGGAAGSGGDGVATDGTGGCAAASAASSVAGGSDSTGGGSTAGGGVSAIVRGWSVSEAAGSDFGAGNSGGEGAGSSCGAAACAASCCLVSAVIGSPSATTLSSIVSIAGGGSTRTIDRMPIAPACSPDAPRMAAAQSHGGRTAPGPEGRCIGGRRLRSDLSLGVPATPPPDRRSGVTRMGPFNARPLPTVAEWRAWPEPSRPPSPEVSARPLAPSVRPIPGQRCRYRSQSRPEAPSASGHGGRR